MATALASLLTRRPVRPYTGMTGEITLRGKVLPIGGIKEKVLAAARFGLKRVILPRRNESDLDDVPEAVREQIEFVLVDTVDEVLEAALLPEDAGDDGHPAEQHKIEKNTEKDRAAAVATTATMVASTKRR